MLHMCLCVCERACVRMPRCVGVCVCVALFILQATRMRHIRTSFAAPLAPPQVPNCLTNGMIFEKNIAVHKSVF
jgi:hypothetical protein